LNLGTSDNSKCQNPNVNSNPNVQFQKLRAMDADTNPQITQICADWMKGSLEPPQRGVPNAATLGDMESPVDKKQASLFFIIWVSI
jgi:hypothetical protein